jgi:hypothetical protein
MPWGAVAGVVGSVAGSAISSAMAPSTSGGGGSYYVPTGLSGADTAWQDLLRQQQTVQGGSQATLPYYQESLAQGLMAQNQYAAPYQQAANAAGGQYGTLGQQLQNASGLQFGAQQGLLNAGQQVYNTAFDPQSALYNRTLQQLQDQTGATNSMYGLGSSAAGAGVANQALSNFNIDWQNQQLQRQLSGLQGYGSAIGQAGQAGAQGGALGGAGAGYTLQGGQLPYQTSQGLAGYQGQLASQYNQGVQQGPLATSQSINSQIIPYLNYGQGAQAIPFQSQQAGAGAAGALASQGIQSLGSNPQFQSALGNIFGGNPAQGYFGSTQTPGNYAGTGYGGYGMGSGGDYYSGGGNSYGFTM